MFNTDKPINLGNEDKLGRSTFAKQLANTITQFKTKDNYVISLQGKWGCGKTSVLNMVVEEIGKNNESLEGPDKTLIVQFNPWNFTDTNQLINQFFITISSAIKVDNKSKKMRTLGAAIESYSSALEYSEYIPIVGKYFKVLPNIFRAYGKSMKDNATKKIEDVSSRKKEVEKALLESKIRILVIIDDIDRLSNTQIQLIFQLVNAVAGFPFITYLLSFDKEIVARALSESQNCNGDEYLEKIIQVPFNIPSLNISKLHSIFFEKMNMIINEYKVLGLDEERWEDAFKSCISPFISTLRDVNRFYNTFTFRYSTVSDEIDFIDMAVISALQVFASPISEWIRENKFSLVRGSSRAGSMLSDVSAKKEEALQLFQNIYPENPQIMLNIITCLFPNFSNSVSVFNNYIAPSELHQAMRIASEKKFDLYFSLSLDDIKISRKELDKSLFQMEEFDLRTYIGTLEERKLFGDYLSELKNNISRIPESRIELFISVLFFQSGRIAEKEKKLIGVNTTLSNVYAISDLLFRVENEEIRFDIIAKMLSNTDFVSFQFMLYLLHIIELTHGRVADTEKKHNTKLVNLENLQKLEKIFLERTKKFLDSTELLEWIEAQRVSFLWKYIEEKTYSEYMKTILKKEINIIKYLEMNAIVWNLGDNLHEYEFKNETFIEYINVIECLEAIEKVRVTKEFWELDEKVINATVAFALADEKFDDEKLIGTKDVIKRIDKWKREFLEQN